jgi:hypothetical protein
MLLVQESMLLDQSLAGNLVGFGVENYHRLDLRVRD